MLEPVGISELQFQGFLVVVGAMFGEEFVRTWLRFWSAGDFVHTEGLEILSRLSEQGLKLFAVFLLSVEGFEGSARNSRNDISSWCILVHLVCRSFRNGSVHLFIK